MMAVALASPATARGQDALAVGRASAQVIQPLVVVSLSDLDFGLVAASPTQSGSVIVHPSENKASFNGGARPACHGTQCPAAHPAVFSISGEAGRTYLVQLDPVLTIAPTSPDAPPLQVGQFTFRTRHGTAANPRGQLDKDGRDELVIGATLQVPAGLRPARYRKVLPISVSYE